MLSATTKTRHEQRARCQTVRTADVSVNQNTKSHVTFNTKSLDFVRDYGSRAGFHQHYKDELTSTAVSLGPVLASLKYIHYMKWYIYIV